MRVILITMILVASGASEELSEFQKYAINNPKMLPYVFGAALCLDRKERADALVEIEKEKRYARTGGVVDKAKLYGLQQRIRWADEHEKADLKNAQSWKTKPAPCGAPQVKRIIACKLERECPEGAAEGAEFVSTFDADQ